MAHEWHAGVLTQSSWHGLERVEALPDAETMIRRGEELGAWPVRIDTSAIRTADGLDAPGKAIVGTYADGTRAALGVVSNGYTHLRPEQWRDLVHAATKAGARPTGAFALRGGSRVLATFQVSDANGIRTQLCLADSFDRSSGVLAGTSAIRIVCANTFAAAMRRDGSSWGSLRHDSSLPEKVDALGDAITEVVREGGSVRDLYARAEAERLAKDDAEMVLAALFPVPEVGKDATPAELAVASRKLAKREDAVRAAARAENDAGPTLATLWNAATWLVDRDVDGTARKSRTPRLDSMLFGARGQRVEEIRNVIEVVLNDGTIEQVEAPEARAHGVDDAQIGRAMLEDMLG